jgi:hypothetical protein
MCGIDGKLIEERARGASAVPRKSVNQKMNKGVSETFEEHEQDTAKRGVPKDLVERAMRTTKMKQVDLEQLVRTASGTRPVVTDDAIEQHVRSQLQNAHDPASALAETSATMPISSSDEDPHARPTIEAVAFHKTHVQAPAREPVAVAPSPTSREAPSREMTSARAMRRPPASMTHVSIPRWLLTAMILGTMMLVAAAGAFGFAAGRFTLHR